MDSPSHEIGSSHDFGEVQSEVWRIVKQISPAHDLSYIERAFTLMQDGCDGRLSGYAALQTPYHDRIHLLDVVLCSVRLLHALHMGGRSVDALTIDASLIGALLHDSGYLMRDDEAQGGTGAQWTLTHVPRGAVFAEVQLGALLPPELMSATGKVILTTDHRPVAIMPDYDTHAQRLAAHVTGTADLVAQMANREYLERLMLLFFEFREAGIEIFTDVHDLMEKTGSFHQAMTIRLQSKLGDLAPHLVKHFEQDRGVSRNYYIESIDRNLGYLAMMMQEARDRRFEYLKRGGVVDRALDMLEP